MGEIDWSRVLVLGAVIFVVALAREHLGILQSESRWKRAIYFGLVIFVVLLVIEFIWPTAA